LKRAGFTLIELVISIAIIALIVTYLYQSLGILKNANEHLQNKDAVRAYETGIKKLLLLDIMQSSDLKISQTDHKNFDLLTLTSSNSLHNIKLPNITYLVTKREGKLIRIEGLDYKIENLTRDTVYRVKFDELKQNITHFKLYEDTNKTRLLINIKEKGNPLEVLEILKP
jgi:prepilin-type N-terminal cleavage/methylation domain-containing protein